MRVSWPKDRDPRQGATSVPTLREAADKVIALHAANWKDGGKSAAQWQASLDAYTMPRLGSRTVDRITTADVMAVLMPIWNDKRETARRVRQRPERRDEVGRRARVPRRQSSR